MRTLLTPVQGPLAQRIKPRVWAKMFAKSKVVQPLAYSFQSITYWIDVRSRRVLFDVFPVDGTPDFSIGFSQLDLLESIPELKADIEMHIAELGL